VHHVSDHVPEHSAALTPTRVLADISGSSLLFASIAFNSRARCRRKRGRTLGPHSGLGTRTTLELTACNVKSRKIGSANYLRIVHCTVAGDFRCQPDTPHVRRQYNWQLPQACRANDMDVEFPFELSFLPASQPIHVYMRNRYRLLAVVLLDPSRHVERPRIRKQEGAHEEERVRRVGEGDDLGRRSKPNLARKSVKTSKATPGVTKVAAIALFARLDSLYHQHHRFDMPSILDLKVSSLST